MKKMTIVIIVCCCAFACKKTAVTMEERKAEIRADASYQRLISTSVAQAAALRQLNEVQLSLARKDGTVKSLVRRQVSPTGIKYAKLSNEAEYLLLTLKNKYLGVDKYPYSEFKQFFKKDLQQAILTDIKAGIARKYHPVSKN